MDVAASRMARMDRLDAAAAQSLENYIIVDVGANLTNKKFSKDLDNVVTRAKDAG